MKTAEETVREILWLGFNSAANAYRLYPENKHTFSDHSDFLIGEGNKIISEYKNGWIDVKEQLPQINKYVLVFGGLTGNRTNLAWLAEDGNGQKVWTRVNSQKEFENVTHWMPLPSPPKSHS